VRKVRERPGCRRAEDDTDHQPETQLAYNQQGEITGPVVRLLDPVDQADRQRDRHRVVAAGLRFERSSETPSDAGETERREHRCRVRRRDNRAEQYRL
jgi:hypothetical protein